MYFLSKRLGMVKSNEKTLLESVGIEARPPGLANSRLPQRHWLQYQLPRTSLISFYREWEGGRIKRDFFHLSNRKFDLNLLKWNVKLIFYISANCLTAVLLICRRDFRLLFLKKKQLRVFFDALVSDLVKKRNKGKKEKTPIRGSL